MYIAISKRKEHIAEYILYLWQLEVLLRALQFSPEAVYSQLVEPRGIEPDRQQELLIWYMDIVNLLREEGKEQSGHLDHTLHIIEDLQNLHRQLMQLPVGERYRTHFNRLSPELPRLREIIDTTPKQANDDKEKKEVSDIELCFRALYAAMLYRLKGEGKGQKAIDDVLDLVSPVVAELADTYRKIEQGELDMFKNE